MPEWLVGPGIVGGFTHRSFAPGLPVTRAQTATILANVYQEQLRADGGPSTDDVIDQ